MYKRQHCCCPVGIAIYCCCPVGSAAYCYCPVGIAALLYACRVSLLLHEHTYICTENCCCLVGIAAHCYCPAGIAALLYACRMSIAARTHRHNHCTLHTLGMAIPTPLVYCYASTQTQSLHTASVLWGLQHTAAVLWGLPHSAVPVG